MESRPIPAFYCCYLLRSTVRHASLYVGSTPNPARRRAQHNGLNKGGARRTGRLSLRPWEMTCVVTGFPSNIAALQFEWAWQNTHLTRRISDEERITLRTTVKKKGKDRIARPSMSINDKLSNLHLLLRVPSFSRWPLEVRFFNEEIYHKWLERSSSATARLPPTTKIVLDLKEPLDPTLDDAEPLASPKKRGDRSAIGMGGVEGIDATYLSLQSHVEKSLDAFAEGQKPSCSVCHNGIQVPGDMALVCPGKDCKAVFHMPCLSRRFLGNDVDAALVPTNGQCPSCKTDLKWVDLVKEMTLRLRGGKELERLTKKRRSRKNKDQKQLKTPIPIANGIMDDDDDVDDDTLLSNILEELTRISQAAPTGPKTPSKGPSKSRVHEEYDDLDGLRAEDVADEPRKHEAIDLLSDDDASSVASETSEYSVQMSPGKTMFRLPPGMSTVIEDSDCEAYEVVD